MIYHNHVRPDAYQDEYALDDLAVEVRNACADLLPHRPAFDVIAATGLSGILPGAPVSITLNVPLAILRKPGDNAHQRYGHEFSGDGSFWVNGNCVAGSRVLWLDDFTSSGETRARILSAVAELGGHVVAQYLTREREVQDHG